MTLLQDGVIAFLAAVGLTALVWLIVGLFPHLKRPKADALLLVPARDDTALEYSVHELEELRLQINRAAPILIVDCGMGEENRKIAELLIGEEEGVMLTTPEEVKNYFM